MIVCVIHIPQLTEELIMNIINNFFVSSSEILFLLSFFSVCIKLITTF